uniref:Uncharacterized protein n=1 Tax=Arion vulgaris TaxID=1028688 RepID=A0A0B7AAH1_9EUPU
MSVQLSELTARFNMSEMKRPSVRRCLFGRPDSEKLYKNLERQDRIMYEEDARRFRENWSFDPVTGPLEGGKFQYEVIAMDSSCENVPNFYTKSYSSCSRKSRPVRVSRDHHGFSSIHNYKPYSAKRKLDLESQENDENEVVDKRVPNRGDIVNDSHLLPSCMPDSEEYTCGRLCPLPGGLTHLSPVSSLPELSPTSRNKDITTPTSIPKSMVQSSMKDFLSTKKQRMLNTKALPRT